MDDPFICVIGTKEEQNPPYAYSAETWPIRRRPWQALWAGLARCSTSRLRHKQGGSRGHSKAGDVGGPSCHSPIRASERHLEEGARILHRQAQPHSWHGGDFEALPSRALRALHKEDPPFRAPSRMVWTTYSGGAGALLRAQVPSGPPCSHRHRCLAVGHRRLPPMVAW